MQLSDFLGDRTGQLVALLREADAPMQEATLRMLLEVLQRLPSKCQGPDICNFAEHIGRLFIEFPGAELRSLQIEGLLRIANVLFFYGSPARAAHHAQCALDRARELGQPELRRRAANDAAGYCLRQRDFAGALALLEEAYEVSRANGLEDGRLRALANIAACLQEAGYYRQAVEVTRPIVELASASGGAARERQAAVLGNLVHCHLALGELDEALAAGERGARMVDADGACSDPLARHQFESFFNAALLEAGRVSEARARLRQLRVDCAQTTPQTELLFSLTQGMCEVFSGQIDIGISRLEQLLPRAVEVGWYIDDVLRALVRAHEKGGDLQRALQYVDRLTEHFATMRTRQLHEQLQQIKNEALGQLDAASRAEVLLGEQAASLRVKSFHQRLAERERTVLENWAVAVSLIDDATGKHCFRVGRLSYLMALRLGLDADRAELIEMAARLHDIGKIGINHQILLKPSMLTEAERVIMRKHPLIGAEMLSASSHPGAKLAATVSATHHEWWDGTGYPKGLRHDAIPLESRIIALADVYDVLTSGRPYKRAWPHQLAVDELRFMGGRQFDPELAEVFVELVDEYTAVYGEAGDEQFRAAVRDCALVTRQANIRSLVEAQS